MSITEGERKVQCVMYTVGVPAGGGGDIYTERCTLSQRGGRIPSISLFVNFRLPLFVDWHVWNCRGSYLYVNWVQRAMWVGTVSSYVVFLGGRYFSARTVLERWYHWYREGNLQQTFFKNILIIFLKQIKINIMFNHLHLRWFKYLVKFFKFL